MEIIMSGPHIASNTTPNLEQQHNYREAGRNAHPRYEHLSEKNPLLQTKREGVVSCIAFLATVIFALAAALLGTIALTAFVATILAGLSGVGVSGVVPGIALTIIFGTATALCLATAAYCASKV